jgi:EAL domain-containing protein (putative c-di-GMP-specific phosphodiesterase class I)/DNA-binding NarL/FixJ family response regulator
VASGGEAFAQLAESTFDVLVLDVRLPDMEGWEILSALKSSEDEARSSIPVLILSGSGSPMDRIRGAIEGAVEYVTKPFSASRLNERIASLLDGTPEPELRRRVQQQALLALAKLERRTTPPTASEPDTREPERRPERAPSKVDDPAWEAIERLNPGQQDMLCAVSQSDTIGEAAQRLGVSPAAVAARLRSIATRLGMEGTTELVGFVRRADIAARFDIGRRRLEAELDEAVARHELRLHYQPEVSLVDGTVVGAEALLRWQHPRLGLLGAGEFVPTAESAGSIVRIGAWALAQACRDYRQEWADRPEWLLSVNVSARELRDPSFVETVAAAIETEGIPPGVLCLEVTETSLVGDHEPLRKLLDEVRSLGVRIRIDDFGTGYSSLTHLKRFPIDALKVDRSFVAGLPDDADDAAIVRAVVDLAHAFSLSVVAEGVENERQLAALRALGCEFGQGHLWGLAAPLGAPVVTA